MICWLTDDVRPLSISCLCVKTCERASPLPLSSLPVPLFSRAICQKIPANYKQRQIAQGSYVKTPISVLLPLSTLPATEMRMSTEAPPGCGLERTSTSATRPLRTPQTNARPGVSSRQAQRGWHSAERTVGRGREQMWRAREAVALADERRVRVHLRRHELERLDGGVELRLRDAADRAVVLDADLVDSLAVSWARNTWWVKLSTRETHSCSTAAQGGGEARGAGRGAHPRRPGTGTA